MDEKSHDCLTPREALVASPVNAGAVIPRCLLVDPGWLLGPFHAPPPSLAYGYTPAEEGRSKTRVGKDVG